MIKKYTVSYNLIGSIIMDAQIRIDHEKAEPFMQETVEFFAGTESLLKQKGLTKAFLTLLGKKITWLVIMGKCLDIEDVREKIVEEEGWCYVHQLHGIYITHFDGGVDVDEDAIDVDEIEELRSKGGES